MATTFQKRQKEMKRLEKQRAKAERRAQKKLDKGAKDEAMGESLAVDESSAPAAEPEPQN